MYSTCLKSESLNWREILCDWLQTIFLPLLLVFCTIKGVRPFSTWTPWTFSSILSTYLHTYNITTFFSFWDLLELFACNLAFQDYCFYLFVFYKTGMFWFNFSASPLCVYLQFLQSCLLCCSCSVINVNYLCYSLFVSVVCYEFPIPPLPSMCLS